MITGSQARAARALLDWTQLQLAEKCGVTARTIRSFEDGAGRPFDNTVTRIQHALEDAGIIFLQSAAGYGVMIGSSGPTIGEANSPHQ